MPDSNLARVAAWLAEEERKKAEEAQAAAPVRQVFAKAPAEGHANWALDLYQHDPKVGTFESRTSASNESAVRGRGFEEVSPSRLLEMRAEAHPVEPPKGSLPFISNTPTHPATKPAFAYMPTVADPGMAEAMSGAASKTGLLTGEGRFLLPAGAPPSRKPDPKATLAKARRSREVSVRSTKEGVQPTLREPVDPLATRGAAPALPSRVSTFLQGRRPPSGLEEAQRRANVNQLSANLGRSAEFLGAGVGGVRQRPEAYDNLQEQAGQPVEQYQQRAAEERQEEQDELALKEAEAEATRAAEEMQFRQGRATAEDQLARDRMAQEERIAGKRLEGEEADRALRRSELSYRKKEGEELKKEMAKARQTERQSREDELDLQRLGTATSKGPFGEMQESLESIDRLVPGLAYGQVPDELPIGMWDRVMRVLEPIGGEYLMTDKGKEYATLIANLRDLVSRKRSGAVLNAGEERHYLKLLGDRVFSDTRSAATGINEVRKGLGRTLRNVQGGYAVKTGDAPSILDRYEATGATSYRAPIFSDTAPPRPTGKTITRPDGSVWQELDNGEAEMVQPPTRRQ
jgi:hypothetical protein